MINFFNLIAVLGIFGGLAYAAATILFKVFKLRSYND